MKRGWSQLALLRRKEKIERRQNQRGEGLCFFLRGCVVPFLFILVESEKRKKRVEKGMVFGEVLLGHLGAVCSLRSMEVLLGL